MLNVQNAKCAVCTTAVCGHKRKRTSVTLEVKLEVLKRFTADSKNCGHDKSSGLQPTTVPTIVAMQKRLNYVLKV